MHKQLQLPGRSRAGGSGFCYSIQRTTGTPQFATVEETIAYGEAAPWANTPFLNGPTTQSCTRYVDGYLSDAPGWRPPNYGGIQNLIRNYQRTCQLNVPAIFYDFFAVVRTPVCPPGFAKSPPNDAYGFPTRCVREVLDCEGPGEVCVGNPVRLADGVKVETAVDAAGSLPVGALSRDNLGGASTGTARYTLVRHLRCR